MPRRIRRRSELNKPVGRSASSLRRPTTKQQGYDSAWERLAKHRRNEDYGLCQACLAQGRVQVATDVDHIIPIHVRPDWRLEFNNTQVLCRSHHKQKTSEDSKRYGSSTATALTEEQQKAREAANQLVEPVRAGDPQPGGGGSFQRSFQGASVAYPARVSPRNWGGGGR